ncbi:MAG: hypothetical protein ACM31C_23200 [Acidobacteriota bacterium]
MRTSIALVILAACATTPPHTQPPRGYRGLHASEHMEAARQHEEAMEARRTWPDTRVATPGRTDQLLVGSPWQWNWDSNVDHERLAALHRSAAAELQAEYQEACGTRSLAEVSVSPLSRYAIGGTNTADGVTIFLSPAAGPPERLLSDIRCHRAWMMLQPGNMEDVCALDLDGIRVDATGDSSGITLQLTVRDPLLVPELQRRAARELELTRHPSGTR